MNLADRHLVIFDFDGTLADTKRGIIHTARTVLSEWGLDPDELTDESLGRLIGPPFPQAYEQVFGLSLADAVEVTRRYRTIYTKLGVEAWPVFPGVPEMLASLNAHGRTLAIASSKMTSLVERGLMDNGVRDLFAVVQAKNDDERTTKADAIRTILAHAGVAPEGAVMVGDRHHDVEAAHEAGIPCVGVTYGATAPEGELEEAGAAAVATSPAALQTLLLG